VQPSGFWDRLAKRYAKQPVADAAAYQTKLEVTRGYLKADMEVLEFGCGTGTTALHHAPFVRHIRAIDISAKMLEIARTKATAADVTNVTFEQSGIEDLDAAGASYDAVMGHSILHLVEDRANVIARVHGLLKPGGVFVSSTVCLGGTMAALKLILPIGRFFGLLPLIRFFTVDELASDITDAGFGIVHQWQPGKDKAVFIVAIKPE